MKILVSGLLAYDKIMDFPGRFSDHMLPDKIHQLNISFVTDELSENFGGCAGNIAYSLALLGEQPVILASAGKDFAPYREHLQKLGIDLRFVRAVANKPTSVATMMTDQADNQIAAVYLGTMAYTSPFPKGSTPTAGGISAQRGGSLKSSVAKGDHPPLEKEEYALAIIAPGNVKDMQRLPGMYRRKKIPFIFDPSQEIPLLSGEDLKNGITGSKALMSNDYELNLIMEKTRWSEQEILKHTEMLVTTLGEQGSVVRTAATAHKIPPAKVKKVVDPTGAGDAYRAGFIKGLIYHWPIETCARFAGVVAAYAIEKYGTQHHQFTFTQVKERYVKAYGKALPRVG